MFHTLGLLARLGVITTAHCENAELSWPIAGDACWRRVRLGPSGTSPAVRRPWRPKAPAALRRSWNRPGATGYVVHLSCAPALRAAVEAKAARRQAYTSNRCFPHFLLDKTYAERAGVEGMKHVMSPPLRDKRNQPVLWSALDAGLIDTVGTDHCPFDTEQKLLGAKAFHADSQRHSRHRGSREPDVHLRRQARRPRSSPLRRCRSAPRPQSSSASSRAREP